MNRAFAAVFVVLALSPRTLLAVTKYLGVEPGWSKRADAVTALGDPVRTITPTLLEFRPQEDTGPIFVELRVDASDVVDRIEVRFRAPVARTALIEALTLPPSPLVSEVTSDGRLMEYFGDAGLALSYAARDAATGAISIGYYSDARFERDSTRARNASPPTGHPPAPPPTLPSTPIIPPSSLVPPSVKRDPLACYDLYTWARIQEDAARKAKQTPRRQLAADIRIAAQAADCDRARKLVEQYKKQFGGTPPGSPR